MGDLIEERDCEFYLVEKIKLILFSLNWFQPQFWISSFGRIFGSQSIVNFINEDSEISFYN